MPPYPVMCSCPDCGQPAGYKIAARWSDGVTEELKTYFLCCGMCLADKYQGSRRKQAACRLAAGETLEPPGIYELERGQRDHQLVRRVDLEQRLSAPPEPPASP
jgi:hypothetical protein